MLSVKGCGCPADTSARSTHRPRRQPRPPSRIRIVLRISLGITTLPKSSILLTIPVAFIYAKTPHLNEKFKWGSHLLVLRIYKISKLHLIILNHCCNGICYNLMTKICGMNTINSKFFWFNCFLCFVENLLHIKH